MRPVLVTTIVSVLCVGLCPIDLVAGADGGIDALEKEKGVFRQTLVHPQADFSHYASLLPTTVVLQFQQETEVAAGQTTGSLTRGRNKGDELPNRQDREVFKQVFYEAVVHALDDDQSLDVVDEGGPGTLLVQITMLDIDSNIPPEAPDPGKKVRPVTAQGVVVFDLIDAETGVLQARVGERRRSRRAKGVEVPEGIGERWVQVFELAESAAIDLRTELDRLRDGA